MRLFCNVVVMIRRINSNSSHGNDYVLADTRQSQRQRCSNWQQFNIHWS